MPAAPSLLIVPYRSKTGKLYSQIPTSGAGDFTVTRNTEARRFDSAGLIASVASGIPRLDYLTSGGTAGCPALLVEPSGTNLAFHSENWGSNWILDGATRTTGSTSAFLTPDGTFTATALSPTSGNVAHYIYSNTGVGTKISFTSGTIYTQSTFFKQGTGVAGRYAQLTFVGANFSQLGYANFDLQLGTVAVVSGTSADANRTARIENYGNGWYRCSLTATCTASSTNEGVYCLLVNLSGNTRAQAFSGTVTDTLYGWGAQLETGRVATSYIPTTTASLSRSADVISVSGAVSGSIGQVEGTIYAEVGVRDFSSSVARNIVSLRVDGNNLLSLEMNAAGNGFDFLATSGGVGVTASASGITTGIYKIAVGYNSAASGTVLYVNGVLRDTKTIAIPNLSAAVFGLGVRGDGAAGTQLNDRIRAVALYTTRLTNSELATLTTP